VRCVQPCPVLPLKRVSVAHILPRGAGRLDRAERIRSMRGPSPIGLLSSARRWGPRSNGDCALRDHHRLLGWAMMYDCGKGCRFARRADGH
jgi:hypothetical protein